MTAARLSRKRPGRRQSRCGGTHMSWPRSGAGPAHVSHAGPDPFEMGERRTLGETRSISLQSSAPSTRPVSLLLPRPALFEHAIIPVPSSMPTLQQLCDLVARTSQSSSGATGPSDTGRLSMAAWHKFAKETFKMDTVCYMHLPRSDGSLTCSCRAMHNWCWRYFLIVWTTPMPETGN
jgi:hypothetical protein